MKRFVATLVLAARACMVSAMVIDPVDPAFSVEAGASPEGAGPPVLTGLAVAPDGRVAALFVHATTPACLEVTATVLAANGAADTSFGVNGRASGAMLGVPACTGAAGLAAGPDGALVFLAGDASGRPCVVMARADGHANADFGCAAVPGVDAFAHVTLQVLADGAIAIGGTARRAGSQQWGLAVARLLASGQPDATYGSGGLAFAVPPDRPIFVQMGGGMVVSADGSALVAGSIFEDDAGARTYTDATIVRFDARGVLDAAYGERGFAIPVRDASTYAQSLAARDGVAYLAGVQNRDVAFAFVAKVDASGRVDLRYGEAGFAGTDRFQEMPLEPTIAVDAAHRVYYVLTAPYQVPRVTRLTRDGVPDDAFGLEGSAYPAARGTTTAGRARIVLAGDTPYVATGILAADADRRPAIGLMRLRPDGGRRADVTAGTAILYYNPSLDHYFMTASPSEQALLDSGVTAGWRRTGERFRVVTSASPDPELSPVCRYYGRPEAKLDSHFFSAAADECAAVAQKFAASWLLETSQAFQVHLPERVTGACPRGSLKIFRAFNNRADVNHYYGWLPPGPAGWVPEGYGPAPYPTAFCAPLL